MSLQNYFKVLPSQIVVKKDEEIGNIFEAVFNKYNVDSVLKTDYKFDVELIDRCINELKFGKAAGCDDIVAEHLKNAHPIICIVLNKLFNLCMEYEYVPSDFGIGLIIPIPKTTNSANCHKLDNFRGITISPVISKIFEQCLFSMFADYLTSSANQFGFKKGKGTRDAIFAVNESVSYYVNNCSTVNICTIDISKAFDKINHKALFIKLIKRKTPMCFVKILVNWYSKCFCRVRWESALSEVICLKNSIRQGGILSPFLFAVYVDDALLKLVNSGLGCSFYGINFGAIMYADDILLLAGSRTNLQELISMAEQLFDDVNLKFNVRKCNTMKIGEKCNSECTNLKLSNGDISWQREIKYLGVMFIQAPTVKVNLHPNKVKFYQAFNGIYAKLGSSCNVDTIVHLLKSNCLSALLYDLESVNMNKTDLNNLQFPVSRAFIKIFHIRETISINWCMYYMHMLPVEYMLDARRFKYLKKMSKSNCYVMQHLFNNSTNAMTDNICRKYDLQCDISHDKLLFTMWDKFYHSLVTI